MKDVVDDGVDVSGRAYLLGGDVAVLVVLLFGLLLPPQEAEAAEGALLLDFVLLVLLGRRLHGRRRFFGGDGGGVGLGVFALLGRLCRRRRRRRYRFLCLHEQKDVKVSGPISLCGISIGLWPWRE